MQVKCFVDYIWSYFQYDKYQILKLLSTKLIYYHILMISDQIPGKHMLLKKLKEEFLKNVICLFLTSYYNSNESQNLRTMPKSFI